MRRQKRLLIYLLDERQELAASLVMNCFSLRDQEIMLTWIDGLSIRVCV
jgi:hypothetical protein